MPSAPKAETSSDTQIRRHLIGVIGVVLLAVGIYFYVYPPESGATEFLQGSCVKSGLILVATWLAFPQLDRLPLWLFGSVVFFLVAIAIRPRVVLVMLSYSTVLIPIFALIWFLRPKRK